MDDQEAVWRNLCESAWAEQDPFKLLEVTMKIIQFLARKQEVLDTEFEERERKKGLK